MPQISSIPVFFLAFAQSTSGEYLEELKKESSLIRDLFLPMDKEGRIKLLREESTRIDDVVKLLAQFKDQIAIFHYAGHADGQSLLLEDKRGQSIGISQLLKLQKGIKLVFLNGCSTEDQAYEYLDAGIPIVIATTRSVPDKDATYFSECFYYALAQNYSIYDAFKMASASLRTISVEYNQLEGKIIVYRGLGKRQGVYKKGFPWKLYVRHGDDELLNWQIPALTFDDKLSLEEEKSAFLAYSQWLKKEYNQINLPAIKEGQDLPKIPLEQVYVALKVSGKSANRELELASQQFIRKYQNILMQLGHEPSEAEKIRIYEEVLQQNELIKAWDEQRKEALNISGSTRLSDNDQNVSINLAEAFQNERYLVILGDPGSGKSTLVKWLCLCLINALDKQVKIGVPQAVLVPQHQVDVHYKEEKELVDLGPARLPILLRISDYARFYEEKKRKAPSEARGIIDYLGFHIPSIPDVNPYHFNQLIRKYLDQDMAVVMLDGLDEVTNNRNDILREVNSFIDHWIRVTKVSYANLESENLFLKPVESGGNQLVVTSREVGYQAAPLTGGLTHVKIEKMEEAAVRHFCSVWIKQLYLSQFSNPQSVTIPQEIESESVNLQAAIFDDEKPRIRELATNPLLVTILALIFRHQRGRLPEGRAELYQRSLQILLDKWKGKTSIQPQELSLLLAPLAAHIHENLSDDIRETDLIYFLEVQLNCIRNSHSDGQIKIPDVIHQEVLEFVQRLKEDVGLLAERGENLYHFLHRTFQEYLAGLHLLADKSTASKNIIDRIDDPIWREPIILALGIADMEWPSVQLEKLIKSLLFADDPLLDLLPRSSLFIANAIPEMDNVSEELITSLLQQLLKAYCDLNGIAKYKNIQQQLTFTFNKLKKGKRGDVLGRFLFHILESPSSANEWTGTVALIREQKWWNSEWLILLLNNIDLDQPEWGWPANKMLQDYFSTEKHEENPSSLLMRNKLLQNNTWSGFVKSSPSWMRLMAAFYGGWKNEEYIGDYFQNLDERWLLEKGLSNVPNSNDESARLNNIATDYAEKFSKTAVDFDPQYIYRDGSFSRNLLRAINRKEPASSLEPFFLDKWENGISIETKAQAMLGLLCIGYNSAALIYKHQIESTNIEAIKLFLSQLDRVQESLKSSLAVAYFHFSKKTLLNPATNWEKIPKERRIDTMHCLFKTFTNNGFPHIHGGFLDKNKRLWNLVQEDINTPLAAALEAEYLLGLSGFINNDMLYSSMVALDTLGRELQKNYQLLLRAICIIPKSPQLNNQYQNSWQMPAHYFEPNENGQLMLALQIIDGLSTEYDFLKEWFIVTIWPLLEKTPLFKPYAYAILYFSSYKDRISLLAPDIFDDRKGIATLVVQIRETKSAYSRLLAAGKMFRQTFHPDFLKLYLEAFAELEFPEALFLGTLDMMGLLTHSSSAFFETYVEKLSIKEVLKIDVIQQIILKAEEVIPKMRSFENQLKAWCYLSNLQTNENKAKQCVFRAMNLIPLLSNDEQKALSLSFILNNYGQIAQTYSKWQKINVSFQDQWQLNKGLGKSYMNWISLDGIAADSSDEENFKPIPSLWAILGLSHSLDEMKFRFSKRDELTSLWGKITNDQDRNKTIFELQQFGRDGLKLDMQSIRAVDQLLKEKAYTQLDVIMPLLEEPESTVLPLLEQWAGHEWPKLEQLFALLQAENGQLSPIIIEQLIDCLKSDSDRIRYRAMIAIHGADPTSRQLERKFFTSGMSIDCFKRLAELIYKEHQYSPIILQVFVWLNHNLIHDNPKLIDKAIDLLKSNDEADKNTGEYIIKNTEKLTNTVWQRLLFHLYSANAENGDLLEALLRAVSKQCYLDSNYRSDLIPSPKEIFNYINEDHLILLQDKFSLPINTPIIESVLLETTPKESSSVSSTIQLFKLQLAQHLQIDYQAAYKEGRFLFYQAMKKGGSGNYVSIDPFLTGAQNLANKIIEQPDLVELFIKWTLEELDEELIDYKSSNKIGGYLAVIMANIAIYRPETFLSLVDQKYTKDLLIETVETHSFWFARQGAVALLASMGELDEAVLGAFKKALKDISYPREQAQKSFVYLNAFHNEKVLEQLFLNIKKSSGLIAQISILILSEICRDDKTNVATRKVIIEQISKILREMIENPLLRRSVYIREPRRQKPTYLTSLDNILYDELIKIVGLS